ncbi:DUF1003 domain-containing protein [Paenibacillus koleovorans]|uniref:DUF1003 domain-containing protein n=1 Tax=Paenibacillus koleovorans TaxID=121608 RepID=UPI001FE2CCC4|nr:DUF1003 domain-containing protein [Paenibacillus koleovorans]
MPREQQQQGDRRPKQPEHVKKRLYDELDESAGNVATEMDESLERITRMVNEYNERIKAHLNEEQEKRTSWSERLADRIADFGGSWTFIVIFAGFLIVWMIWNALSFTIHFDKPPYVLMNLVLSCLAAFQAPIILMSQNRQATRDKQEAMMDFAINYKAERENVELKRILRRIENRLDSLERVQRLHGLPGVNGLPRMPEILEVPEEPGVQESERLRETDD